MKDGGAMNQIEERKYYEDDDEIDLMELIRTLGKYKGLILTSTLLVALLCTGGGYLYNKINTVNSTIIGFNYPEIENGKNPDGSVFFKDNIIPLNVINKVYTENKDKIKADGIADFKTRIKVEGIIPEATEARIENALKKGEILAYTPTQYKISTKESKEILEELSTDSIVEFINKYKPNYAVAEIEEFKNYDYDNIYTLLNDRIALLKSNINSETKQNYISNKLGYSFNELSVKLESLDRVELQDYYSYFTVHGLSLSKVMRETRYDSEIREIRLEKEKLQAKAQIIKSMLEQYKPTNRNIVVPNVGEFGIKINTENEYYSGLINEYLNVNSKIKDEEFTIKKLQEEKEIVNYPSENQKKVIDQKLNVITTKLNGIINELNKINEEYVNAKYSDMIKIVSPVTEINNGKPVVLFLAIGIVLGGMLGIFLAFMKEFAKNYKAKYSK